jgi:hypothetical protein
MRLLLVDIVARETTSIITYLRKHALLLQELSLCSL